MSREASMKFKPASIGDSYDKMSQCAHCFKEPTAKKPFPLCSACKEASFCSKECQAKAWPLHKTVCQWRKKTVAAMANTPSSPSFPPFKIRKRLLTDFIEVHECSFHSAFSSALILEGGIDNFPYDKRGILVRLKYRPDCQENPSVAYSIVECAWKTLAQMSILLGKDLTGSDAMSTSMDTMMRGKHPGYRGMLRVYFLIEDNFVGEFYPQAHERGVTGEIHRTYIATLDHNKWASRVQQFVRDGLVMRQPDANVVMMQLGRMKMKKGNWVWVQLTKAELIELGYPANFPGLLF